MSRAGAKMLYPKSFDSWAQLCAKHNYTVIEMTKDETAHDAKKAVSVEGWHCGMWDHTMSEGFVTLPEGVAE